MKNFPFSLIFAIFFLFSSINALVPNCRTLNGDNSTCYECSPGYSLVSGNCSCIANGALLIALIAPFVGNVRIISVQKAQITPHATVATWMAVLTVHWMLKAFRFATIARMAIFCKAINAFSVPMSFLVARLVI